jgi:hypothetical protein
LAAIGDRRSHDAPNHPSQEGSKQKSTGKAIILSHRFPLDCIENLRQLEAEFSLIDSISSLWFFVDGFVLIRIDSCFRD